MGIERFFHSLITDKVIGEELTIDDKIDINYMFIDFNSILYKISLKIEDTLNKLLIELLYEPSNISEESIQIAKEWNYSYSRLDVKDFSSFFDEEKIENKFLDMIEDEIMEIINDNIDTEKLEKVYISMDGVPNMAKMIEQKRRRYMGYVLSETKKGILRKYENNMDNKRIFYENNKIVFSRSKFLGFQEFMLKVSNRLKDDKFIDRINVQQYIFSGSDVPGEGEKKIMEDILDKQLRGKYMIYSPDSDLIILSTIMQNKLNNGSDFYVLRYDQQREINNIININVLINNIISYLELENCDNLRIIDDIMFLFTMFGNDFVHKIESIDAKKDFEILLDIYYNYMTTYNEYILNNENINHNSLRKYLKIIKDYENDLMNDSYLIKNYKNYGYLKRTFNNIFWFDTLHRTIIYYIDMANIVFENMEKGLIDNITDKLNEYVIYHRIDNNMIKQFMKIFLIIELKQNVSQIINDKKIENNFINSIMNINKNNIYPKLRLDKYFYSIKNKFYQNRLSRSMISNLIPITPYDKEIYSFEYMLDDYRYKLGAVDDKIGICTLNIINDRYQYDYEIYDDYYRKYYIKYFGKNYDIDYICKQYYEGISWVYNFYFIDNNSTYNYNNISPWFYQYTKSPLLTDLSNYISRINDKVLKEIDIGVKNNTVDRDKFINPIEQYMYVTPKNSIKLDIPELVKEIDRNSKLFPDLDIIVYEIMDPKNKDNKNISIDCRRALYLTKCNIKNMNNISLEDFMKVMKPLRKYYKQPVLNMEPMIVNKLNQIAGKYIKKYKLVKI